MTRWPPIEAPELLERLALDDAEFLELSRKLAGRIRPRECGEAEIERALGYPWERPRASHVHGAGGPRHGEKLERAGRYPLLAFGSNAAAETLRRKLDRSQTDGGALEVVTGRLLDFDVGASAHAAIYGALPATLIPSPGTAVRSAVLWVTADQFTALAWSEFNYLLGRLDDIEFSPDDGTAVITGVFAFVSRHGAHGSGDAPYALDAIGAERRALPARSQRELLSDAARRVLGDQATAEDLIRRAHHDYGDTAELVRSVLKATATPFASAHWTRFGAASTKR